MRLPSLKKREVKVETCLLDIIMFDKVLNLIKDSEIRMPKLLLCNYKNMNITDEELIIIIYLLNSSNNFYNPKDISDNLKIDMGNVLNDVSELVEKGIINLSMETIDNRRVEVIDLEPLYQKLAFLIVNEEEKKEDSTIYSVIESEFGRTLSPLEYDLISIWLDSDYSEELIKEALKEAIYNNVTSLKYIDKILEEWRKKGIKNKDDVLKDKQKFRERKQVKKESFDYDCFSDEE